MSVRNEIQIPEFHLLDIVQFGNRGCTRCANLCRTRTQVVTGVGPSTAKLMLVGEAPGENEDLEGEAFVGRAGDLLNSLLERAGIERKELFITNTVKCRPTLNDAGKKNRAPDDVEIANCKGWLWKELQLVKPKVVVTLGKVPTSTLLRLKTFKMGPLVGQAQKVEYMDSLIVPCWHPSYLLQHGRNFIDDSVEALKQAADLAYDRSKNIPS